MKKIVYFKRAVNVAAFFFLITFQLNSQIRNLGIWVVRDRVVNKKEIDTFINFACENNFTDIFVQVRGRDDAFYNSKIVKKSELIKPPAFDPLQYTITKAKDKGLKVHAWMNIYFVWSSKEFPWPGHIVLKHPDWCAIDKSCNLAGEYEKILYLKNKKEGIFLSPTVSDVNKYLFEVVKEVIGNYDVDGIHFDYIRYPNGNYDYNPEGRYLFKKRYGFDPLLFTISNKDFLKDIDDVIFDTLLFRWNNFLRSRITNFVRMVKIYIDTSGYNVSMSAAVKPDPIEARNYYFQDWINWLEKGYMDFVVPMNYTKSDRRFEEIAREISSFCGNEKVWMGIAVYNQSEYGAWGKTLIAIDNEYNNIVYFSYDYLKNRYYILRNVKRLKKRY